MGCNVTPLFSLEKLCSKTTYSTIKQLRLTIYRVILNYQKNSIDNKEDAIWTKD